MFKIYCSSQLAILLIPVSCEDPKIQLFLIAVTSRLDAVVACTNVLQGKIDHVLHSNLYCG